MSPNDMMKYREAFDRACARFGWRMVHDRVEHERDEDRGYSEEVWLSPQGKRLFAEDDLTEAMVEEVIRLSELIPVGLYLDHGA